MLRYKDSAQFHKTNVWVNWPSPFTYELKSAKICSDICPRTLSVPRREQFSECEARGKLWGTDKLQGQISTEYFPAKTADYPTFPNLQNRACCEKYLEDDKHNGLHMERKYARIFVIGGSVFLIIFLELRALGTFRFSGQVIPADKYPSIFPSQIEIEISATNKCAFLTKLVWSGCLFHALGHWERDPARRPTTDEGAWNWLGWILALFFSCVFWVDPGQYPALSSPQTWSITLICPPWIKTDRTKLNYLWQQFHIPTK